MALREMLSNCWSCFQTLLFPQLEETLGALEERQQRFVMVLECVRVETPLPYQQRCRGCIAKAGLPVLRPSPSSTRAAATTPAEPVGACVARFPTGASLPRLRDGSASALSVSGPARHSLTLRPVWSLSRPWRPVTSKFSRQRRCLRHPLRLLPAGATIAGWDSHPL